MIMDHAHRIMAPRKRVYAGDLEFAFRVLSSCDKDLVLRLLVYAYLYSDPWLLVELAHLGGCDRIRRMLDIGYLVV